MTLKCYGVGWLIGRLSIVSTPTLETRSRIERVFHLCAHRIGWIIHTYYLSLTNVETSFCNITCQPRLTMDVVLVPLGPLQLKLFDPPSFPQLVIPDTNHLVDWPDLKITLILSDIICLSTTEHTSSTS